MVTHDPDTKDVTIQISEDYIQQLLEANLPDSLKITDWGKFSEFLNHQLVHAGSRFDRDELGFFSKSIIECGLQAYEAHEGVDEV